MSQMNRIDLSDLEAIDKRNEKFVRYLKHTLLVLPPSILSLDSSKILLSYFAILSLDLLNKLDSLPHSCEEIINWIYKHQIEESLFSEDPGVCGFRGSTSIVTEHDKSVQNHTYDCSHITMTFAAINALVTLEDDLSRVNKKSIQQSLKRLQLPDGSFTATFDGSENDVRFLYSACCICYVLDDWSGVDKDNAANFLMNCLTYEGAFSQNPEAEAHGGSTFCAVASLQLMNKLDVLDEVKKDKLIRWCMNRQTTGFNGRVNKPWDTCYSFWIGATLKILDSLHHSNYIENINYVFETYSPVTGGFAKWPDCIPDPLHTFTGLCGLSLVKYPKLQEVHPALTITMRANEHLKKLHERWSSERQ